MKLQPGDYIRTKDLTDEQIEQFLQAAERDGARVYSTHADSCVYRFAGEGARNAFISWTAPVGGPGVIVGCENTGPTCTLLRDVTAAFLFDPPTPGDPLSAAQQLGRRFTLAVLSIFTLLATLGAATCAVEARADVTLTASHNIVNTGSGNSFELGYRTASGWHVQAGYQQPARTVFGDRGRRGIFTLTKRREFGDVWFGRFGLAATPGYKLIGPVNFRFGGGVQLGRWEIEYMHASSAGIFETNRGLDSVGVRYVF